MSTEIPSQSLAARLQPYLQDTLGRRSIQNASHEYQLLSVSGKHTIGPQLALKLKMITALFTAAIETLTYAVMSLFARTIGLVTPKAQSQIRRYSLLTKGATAAVTVAAMSVWDVQHALNLPSNIEKYADQECRNVAEGGMDALNAAIIVERKTRLRTVREKMIDEAKGDMPVFDYQAQLQRERLKQVIQEMTSKYSTLESHHKYESLEQIREEMKRINQQVKVFVYLTSDKQFFDIKAELISLDILTLLRPLASNLPSSKAEEFLGRTSSELKQKTMRLQRLPENQKEKAFDKLNRELKQYLKTKTDELKCL